MSSKFERFNEKMVEEFLELVRVPSRSGRTYLMEEYIENKLRNMNVKYNKDRLGNIFYLKKNTPVLSAHMDTVGESGDLAVLHYARVVGDEVVGFGNLGADDKCGIFIVLKMLEKYGNRISFILSVDEEVGGTGIKHIASTQAQHLSELKYGLVLDRRNGTDIIGTGNWYCTDEFEKDVQSVLSLYGYRPAVGSFSDADTLSNFVSVVNLSVGYYKPHTESEYVVIPELFNALLGVEELLESLDKKYDKPDIKPIYKYGNKYGNKHSIYRDIYGIQYNDVYVEHIDEKKIENEVVEIDGGIDEDDEGIGELIKFFGNGIEKYIDWVDEGLYTVCDHLLFDGFTGKFIDGDGNVLTLKEAANYILEFLYQNGDYILATEIEEKWELI